MNIFVEKIVILGDSKEVTEKKLAKIEKKIKKMSDKLMEAYDSNSTIRKRAVMRSNLSSECEQRDRLLKRLELIERWRKELEDEENRKWQSSQGSIW